MHLVVLTTHSLFTIHKAIKGRFNTARYKVRAIYGSLSKPPAGGACVTEDIIRITTDQELVDFVLTAKEVYSPVWLQVQLHKSDGTIDATPLPDERPYFQASVNQLDTIADFHNAPENDSDAAT